MGGRKTVRRSDQGVADGVDGGFATSRNIELEEDGADVLGGGAGADEEALGDLPIGLAVYHEA